MVRPGAKAGSLPDLLQEVLRRVGIEPFDLFVSPFPLLLRLGDVELQQGLLQRGLVLLVGQLLGVQLL